MNANILIGRRLSTLSTLVSLKRKEPPLMGVLRSKLGQALLLWFEGFREACCLHRVFILCHRFPLPLPLSTFFFFYVEKLLLQYHAFWRPFLFGCWENRRKVWVLLSFFSFSFFNNLREWENCVIPTDVSGLVVMGVFGFWRVRKNSVIRKFISCVFFFFFLGNEIVQYLINIYIKKSFSKDFLN